MCQIMDVLFKGITVPHRGTDYSLSACLGFSFSFFSFELSSCLFLKHSFSFHESGANDEWILLHWCLLNCYLEAIFLLPPWKCSICNCLLVTRLGLCFLFCFSVVLLSDTQFGSLRLARWVSHHISLASPCCWGEGLLYAECASAAAPYSVLIAEAVWGRGAASWGASIFPSPLRLSLLFMHAFSLNAFPETGTFYQLCCTLTFSTLLLPLHFFLLCLF